MKRERSATPSDAESEFEPTTPKKPRAPKSPSKPKTPKTPKTPKSPKSSAGWTNAKRAALVEYVFAEGVKAANVGVIADKIGMSRQQVGDQLKANRANVRRVVEGLFKEGEKEG